MTRAAPSAIQSSATQSVRAVLLGVLLAGAPHLAHGFDILDLDSGEPLRHVVTIAMYKPCRNWIHGCDAMCKSVQVDRSEKPSIPLRWYPEFRRSNDRHLYLYKDGYYWIPGANEGGAERMSRHRPNWISRTVDEADARTEYLGWLARQMRCDHANIEQRRALVPIYVEVISESFRLANTTALLDRSRSMCEYLYAALHDHPDGLGRNEWRTDSAKQLMAPLQPLCAEGR